jgi:hypothetical protein
MYAHLMLRIYSMLYGKSSGSSLNAFLAAYYMVAKNEEEEYHTEVICS